MSSEVVVVDFWANGFGMRARIALEEKGIEYRYVEEDLSIAERSPLVLEMNPVYKSVPVLIHGRRPICDSLVIVQYIDEAWKVGPTLLPRDPYQRALARFWADVINKKVRTPPPLGTFGCVPLLGILAISIAVSARKCARHFSFGICRSGSRFAYTSSILGLEAPMGEGGEFHFCSYFRENKTPRK